MSVHEKKTFFEKRPVYTQIELTLSLTILEEETAFPQKGSFSRNEQVYTSDKEFLTFHYSIAPSPPYTLKGRSNCHIEPGV